MIVFLTFIHNLTKLPPESYD